MKLKKRIADSGFLCSSVKDVPEIAALPWEYLHNGEDFLVTRRSILLSQNSG